MGDVSGRNLELVRSIYERWAEGDFSEAEWADQDIEFVIADGADADSWKGLDAMGAAWQEGLDAWEDFRAIPEEYRELEGDRVLVLLRNRGRGRASGLEVADIGKGANVVHLREGKVTKLEAYWDRDRALADLGLT